LSETSDEVWERDDCVRRTVVLPTELAERLATEAERRGLSVSDLLIEYADEGLRREGGAAEHQ
jgi:CopG-like RHH_1 or ribbon-helix-helix domain, RHH_5